VKKAQINFAETFAIIIIVYIVIVVGMVWYNQHNSKKVEEMQFNDKMQRSFEKYYFIVNLNLLHKTEHTDIDEEFDLTALQVFEKSYMNDPQSKDFIRSQLGDSLVSVDILNFDLTLNQTIIVYNNTPSKIRNIETFRTLIPVYNPITRKNHIGKLTLRSYT